MAKAKRKKTGASAPKRTSAEARKRNTTRSRTRKARAAKSKSAKRLSNVSAMAKKARAATKTRLGKAAAILLAGATAGAVRAVIPQLESAAQSQEKTARRQTKSGQTKKIARSKTRRARASA